MRKHSKAQNCFYVLFPLILFILVSIPCFSVQSHSINIVIDPRLELLAAVQYLSGYGERNGLITAFDFPYKKEVSDCFSQYKDHSAVKLFAEMSAVEFNFDAPPTAMLYLSNPPELTLLTPFSDYLKKRAGGGERLEQFVVMLRDFARQSKFMEFFKKHENLYRQIVAEKEKKLKAIDNIGILENYYGIKQHSYTIILVPLFVGGYGPRIQQKDGTYDIYDIIGPMEVKDGLPAFGSAERFKRYAWHEFSHSFVNPLTEKYKEEIDKYSSLLKPISLWMKGQGYDYWEVCVNEHIIRAVFIRLLYREESKNAAEQEIQDERSRGFFYVEALCKRLEQYETNRERFRTFTEFFPELINVFKELSEAKLREDFFSIPFTGTINGVFALGKTMILIVPTNESDKAIQDKIHAYVNEFHDRSLKDSHILADKEALNSDLSKNALIVFGTVRGNLWLAKIMDKLPVKIKSDKIEADTVYSGDHLRFITAWPNPQNSKKGVLIFTAQQAEDIVDINDVLHGPTDYVIAKGTEVLKAADYKKHDGQWIF